MKKIGIIASSILKTSDPNIYNSAVAVYSLRKVFSWSNAVLKIRRSSDNAEAWVFFDGAVASNLITTSSYISTTSDTTPDTTTLATWIGASNGFVSIWYGMTSNNTINTALKALQATVGNQPRFITAGAIITKNALPAISFDGTDDLVVPSSITALASGSDHTILTVSANSVSAGIGTICCTTNTDPNRFVMFNDRRTTGGIYRAGFITATGVDYAADLLAAQSSDTQRLVSVTMDTLKLMTAYFNGTAQNNVSYAGNYTNDRLRIGSQHTGLTKLNGTIQEIVIFGSDKTGTSLTDLHDDINTYYSIY